MKTAYINGVILSGKEDMTPVAGMTVVTNGEYIDSVQPAGAALPKDCEMIDLNGKYIMPGLINMHVHIPANGKPKKKPSDPRKTVRLVTANKFTRKILEYMYKKYVKDQLLSGVTTIRTVGGVEYYDTWLRDEIA